VRSPDAVTVIETLRRQADACTACPLYRHATQIVFGEGDPRAAIVLEHRFVDDLRRAARVGRHVHPARKERTTG
jgi:hypothetical protein